MINSSLNKGLIFDCALDEWNGTRDKISNAIGVNTDVYPVLDKSGNGRREYSFDGVNDYVNLPSIPAFGTGDFSVVMKVNLKSYNKTLLDGGNNSFSIYITPTGNIRAGKQGIGYNTSIVVVPLNTDCTIGYSRNGTIGTFYINGVADTTTVIDNYDYTVAINKTGETGYLPEGSISMLRVFNYNLTSLQVANYSKPEYPIEWVDRITTSGELIANGTFTTDSDWIKNTGVTIADNVAHSNFSGGGDILKETNKITTLHPLIVKFTISNYSSGYIRVAARGAAWGTQYSSDGARTLYLTPLANANGDFAFYTGTGFVADIDDVSVVQAGCILDLNAEGMSSTTWEDKTNSLTATVSGATFLKPVASNLGSSYFNGTTSNISFADVDRYTLPNDAFSMVFDVNFNDLSSISVPLSKSDSGGSNKEYLVYISSNKISIQLFDYGVSSNYSTFASLTEAIFINTDYTIGFTYLNGVGIIYINGIEVITTKTNIGTGFSIFSNISYPFKIGVLGASTGIFSGKESNVKLYKRALSAEEHMAISNGVK
jgi:hypothetical protein